MHSKLPRGAGFKIGQFGFSVRLQNRDNRPARQEAIASGSVPKEDTNFLVGIGMRLDAFACSYGPSELQKTSDHAAIHMIRSRPGVLF